MVISLTPELVTVMQEAAASALMRGGPIELCDLLWGLQSASPPLGSGLAQALGPRLTWKQPEAALPVHLAIWAQGQAVPFTYETQRLYLAGADSVLLGSYDAFHLAQAIGAAAAFHPERFTRFGFVASAWQRALQAKSVSR